MLKGARSTIIPALRLKRFRNLQSTCCFHTTMANSSEKPVLFFDIDNCLYPKSTRVANFMTDLIDKYFQTHLALSQAEAYSLHQRYYKDYGLAIEGLVRHHKVDPLEYNRQVDDALPLEEVIKPNAALRRLLEDVDRSKVRLWLLTNAYVNHGKRVVRLLGVDDLFEGITYCDYGAERFVCKPNPEMYRKAMAEAGVEKPDDCYFVDDSFINVKGAKELGWTAIHLVEQTDPLPVEKASQYLVRDLSEMKTLLPQFWKSTSNESSEKVFP